MIRWLLTSGGYTVFLRVVAMVTTLAFVSIMSLWMPKADYGVLATMISIATLVAAIGGFGQAELVIREVSPMVEDGDRDGAAHYLHAASAISLAFSLATGLALGLYFLFAGYGWIVAVCVGAIALLLGLNLVWSGAARSHDRYFLALGPKDILWRAGTIAAVGLLILGGMATDIQMVAPICALVLLIAVGGQAWRLRVGPKAIWRAHRGAFTSERMGPGAALMLSALALTAANTADVFLVGDLISPEAAAEYFPANRLALVATFFLMPFQMLIAPRIAQMMKRSDLAGVQHLTSLATLMLGVAGTATAAAILLGYQFYQPLFGTASERTWQALVVLTLGYTAGGFFGLPGVILIMAKKQRLLAIVNATCSGLAILSLLVVAHLGDIVLVAAVVAGFELLRKLSIVGAVMATTGIVPLKLSSLKNRT